MLKFYEKKKSNSEYFIGIGFKDIGNLYSHMQEKSPQQFAKDKRKVLEQELPTDLPYDVLRQTYFDRTQKWFVENIDTRDDISILFYEWYDFADIFLFHSRYKPYI